MLVRRNRDTEPVVSYPAMDNDDYGGRVRGLLFVESIAQYLRDLDDRVKGAECNEGYTKEQCDALHLHKIDLADEVLVLNVDGYIGESRGLKEIILPWARFNNNDSQFILPRNGSVYEEAMRIASEVHPAWTYLNSAAKLLHARDVLQILGMDLKQPVDLVVCWTSNGKVEGGTATGIWVAKLHKIPIINLGYLDPEQIKTFVSLTGILF